MDAQEESFDPGGDSASRHEITDDQWALIEPLIPVVQRRADGKGRPWRNDREVLNGILWVLRHDKPWRAMPTCFPSHQTCRRRFQQWLNDGTLKLILEALEHDLRERGGMDLTRCLPDDINYKTRESEGASVVDWQSRTALLFFSPVTQKLLRRLGSKLARRIGEPRRLLTEDWPTLGIALGVSQLFMSQIQDL